MKKLLIAMMTFLPMWAEAFTGEAVVDGINYYIVTKAQTAEVRALPHSWDYSDSQRYTGNIVIPESIVYEGIECNVTSIGDNAFAGCTGLTSISIGNGVTSIWEGAFSWCSGLASVMIPNNVTFIGNQAFRNCSKLTSIYIGSGILYIGYGSFASCTELTDVYCLAKDVPSIDLYSNPFQDSYIEYATLHVPSTSIDAYRATDPWKKFKTIVAINDEADISGIVFDKTANTPVYDLNGRRLENPGKGINIVGGKKVIVK